MKARKKGEQEWKEYKEVFGPYGEFVGLETAGYTKSVEQLMEELGIDPEKDPFAKSRIQPEYVSRVLPLECFDLWSSDDDEWKKFRKEAAKAAMQGILAHWDDQFSYLAAESYREDEKHTIPNGAAQFAVACADALIKELRRKEER